MRKKFQMNCAGSKSFIINNTTNSMPFMNYIKFQHKTYKSFVSSHRKMSKKNRLNLSIKPNDSIQEEDINMEKLSLGEHLPPPEAAAPLFKVLNYFLLRKI